MQFESQAAGGDVLLLVPVTGCRQRRVLLTSRAAAARAQQRRVGLVHCVRRNQQVDIADASGSRVAVMAHGQRYALEHTPRHVDRIERFTDVRDVCHRCKCQCDIARLRGPQGGLHRFSQLRKTAHAAQRDRRRAVQGEGIQQICAIAGRRGRRTASGRNRQRRAHREQPLFGISCPGCCIHDPTRPEKGPARAGP